MHLVAMTLARTTATGRAFSKLFSLPLPRSERQLRRRWVRLKRKHNIVTISGVQDVLDKLPPIPVEPGPITLEQLVDCFKLPMQDACQKLSVGRPQVLTTQRFRQLFQKHGIARWPYRQVRACPFLASLPFC